MAHVAAIEKRQLRSGRVQVVFVHGVNNRDSADGAYEKAAVARSDRLARLAFGSAAKVRNPYWGKFGRPERQLNSIPSARGGAQTLGLDLTQASFVSERLDPARHDLREIVGSLSVRALHEAAQINDAAARHEIENYWMSAAAYAEMRPNPSWLTPSSTISDISAKLGAEVDVLRNRSSLGEGWKVPTFSANDFAAARLRDWSAGFLAQFLGDALMFFSRREAGCAVRREIAASIIDAARAAAEKRQSLVVIGHSMGGSILHDMLTDPEEIRSIEAELGRPLSIDLFLSVGTQIGLFAELGQFSSSESRTLAVQCANYWNVYDFADTLSFLCAPSLSGVIDFEVNTAGGVIGAHNAYFDNALFYTRLRARLVDVGLTA